MRILERSVPAQTMRISRLTINNRYMKAFIQDRERVLDSVNDLLKTSVYAENLVKVIENTPKDKVFTIGVFGGWGTGKSSIIRTAQDRIEEASQKEGQIHYLRCMEIRQRLFP